MHAGPDGVSFNAILTMQAQRVYTCAIKSKAGRRKRFMVDGRKFDIIIITQDYTADKAIGPGEL
jgi:hypothetical protein